MLKGLFIIVVIYLCLGIQQKEGIMEETDGFVKVELSWFNSEKGGSLQSLQIILHFPTILCIIIVFHYSHNETPELALQGFKNLHIKHKIAESFLLSIEIKFTVSIYIGSSLIFTSKLFW